MYKKELEVAKLAAVKSGKMLKKEFLSKHDTTIKFKKDSERVTLYDKKSEKIILDSLKKNFPNYKILSEESGLNKKDNDLCWVVDPLDGTTNFTIHHPLFSVAIALLKKSEVVMGVIYNPILDELYWATKSGKAYKNGHRLKASNKKDITKSIITYCHGAGPANTKKAYKLYKRFHDISHHCRHFSCTSLELAMIAAGHTEAHMISGAKIWDVAAGVILIKEAGGKVTDWKNKKWTANSKTILAGGKNIHNLCLKELRKLRLA